MQDQYTLLHKSLEIAIRRKLEGNKQEMLEDGLDTGAGSAVYVNVQRNSTMQNSDAEYASVKSRPADKSRSQRESSKHYENDPNKPGLIKSH